MKDRFTSGAQQGSSSGIKIGEFSGPSSALKICDTKAGASGSGSGSGTASGSGSGSGSGLAAKGKAEVPAQYDEEGLANMVASHIAKQQSGRKQKQPGGLPVAF